MGEIGGRRVLDRGVGGVNGRGGGSKAGQGGGTKRARAENQEAGKTQKNYPKSGLGEGAQIAQNAANTNQNMHWGGTGPDKNRDQSLVPGWAAGGNKTRKGEVPGWAAGGKNQEHVWRVRYRAWPREGNLGLYLKGVRHRAGPQQEKPGAFLLSGGWAGGRGGTGVGEGGGKGTELTQREKNRDIQD